MLGMGWFPGTVGGLDRYFRSLFEAMPDPLGVVIGPRDDAPASVTAVAGPGSPLPRRLLLYRRAARAAEADADVIDAHFALYAAGPLLLGPRRRLPVVFHFQGPWARESVAAGDGSRLRWAIRHRLERRVLRRADAHVTLSRAFARLLLEEYGVSPWEVHVIGPGVELERFTPGPRAEARSRLGVGEDAFLAASIRRLVPRTGVDGLLDAWERVADSLPAGSVLLVVGDGPMREELTERAGRPPLAGRVRVMGRLSDEQLVEVYRAADVAVVPSVSVEGFGLVVLEAAACGTPSIVTDVGGLPEVAGGLDPSLVVPALDPAALAERLGAAARGALPDRRLTRSYAERFAWPGVAERHLRLYERLLGGQRQRDPRPRVVYLDHVARLSGGEIALLRLLPHMRGVQAHVILGEEGPLVARLEQAGISVEVLPIAAGARHLRRDAARLGGLSPATAAQTLAYVARLTRRLRRLDPDIVHTNSLKASVYGSLAARGAGVPLVWHLRDRIAEDYLPRPAVAGIRAVVGRLADAVIANSQATLATVPARRAAVARQVIPDSVEPPPLAAAGAQGAITFGMLGRLAPWKGQDLFLRSFAAAFPDGAERAVVVGTAMFGEQSYERGLVELVTELGLAGRVEFRGFREDIWRELAGFDVLVHASVIPEPFGQVVLEGMAAGLPVLAADEGGPAEIIADGKNGRLFRSGESASLAAAMRALRDDPGERRRIAEAARRSIAAYHPDAVGERLERVYAEVLARSPRASAQSSR
jgi:glycosyltransferase involved in cell wall biosynthesis